MKKIIYNKFDKKAITELPLLNFPGKIIVIVSEGEAERAVDYLLSSDILGIDTETRPSFRKGETHKVSLLQVATRTTCFLFRLNYIGITPAILRLLENREVPMVGLSLHDDILSLRKRTEFKPRMLIGTRMCLMISKRCMRHWMRGHVLTCTKRYAASKTVKTIVLPLTKKLKKTLYKHLLYV